MSYPRSLCVLLLLVAALPPDSGAFLEEFQLPLTERPLHDEPPSPSLAPPSPPPPPPPAATAVAVALSGASVDARTRITLTMALRGADRLTLKLTDGFRPGSSVLINPGGATEERSTVRSVAPCLVVLTTALAYAHGVGESVVQLAAAGVPATERPPHDVVAQELDGTTVSAEAEPMGVGPFGTAAAGSMVADLGRARAPASAGGAALTATTPLALTQLGGGVLRFVRGHIGVEAAVALLLCGLLTLCALGCVVDSLFGYTLCCFARGRKKPARAAPTRPSTPLPTQQMWVDGYERGL